MAASPPPPPQPPAIVQPAPFEVSYGVIRGVASRGAQRVVVKVDGRVLRRLRLRGRDFVVDLDLPTGERTIRIETLDASGARAGRTVKHVFALPRAARPGQRGRARVPDPNADLPGPRLDPLLQHELASLARGFPGTTGIYVQHLTRGVGAAWNATATFPAASTLKLAIAVTVLARVQGPPRHGTLLDRLLRSMIVVSDNEAANTLERLIGGSTSGGSALVNSTMRAIGLEDTEMYGGYILGTELEAPTNGRALAAKVPLRTLDQPAWGRGKTTTAVDLARLVRSLWLASAGLGPLRSSRAGVNPREARYLLYLLAHVRDPGKLDRQIRRTKGVAVLHKAGWVDSARHDAGLIVWRGGVFVAAVLTYRATGRADRLAGRVAAASLRRFGG